MMKYMNNPLFFSMTILGIIITMNSSSWLSAWLGMELNIMGFLPMILYYNNSLTYEIIMKYFLISSASSMMMLYFSFFFGKMWWYTFNDFSIFILLALGVKLGSAPFHDWFISFLGGMNPSSAFWLMTIQKLPPLFLMNMCFSWYLMLFFITFSMIIGSLSGFHQTYVMKILAYSSITHLSWMLVTISFLNSFWMIYFMIYFIMLIPIMFFIKNYNMLFLDQMMYSNIYNKFLFFISIMSFSGFPPLLGFFPKLYILFMLIFLKMYLIAMMLIISSIVNLYFYLRLSYNTIFNNSMNMPNINSYSMFFMMGLISTMSPVLFLML